MIKRIHNCHIHLFTIQHVPNEFAGLRLFSIRTVLFVRHNLWPLAWLVMTLLKIYYRWRNQPQKASRLLRFISAGLERSQEDIFNRIRYYYPEETRYIVLPMDMAAMGRGAPAVGIMDQHTELLELRNKLAVDTSGPQIIPFGHIDPRRANALELFKQLHDGGKGVQGLKIYPNLGYPPDHPRLVGELYPYCQKNNLPVMTHCSSGGVHGCVTDNELDPNGDTIKQGRFLSTEDAGSFADPENYRDLLTNFPGLRFCLAHFGGVKAWEDYFHNPETRRFKDWSKRNWLSKLRDMIEEGAYPNLYTDISYTIFYFNEFHRPLKIFLQNDTLRSRVLFGSDFYMTEVEEFRESQLSFGLRAELGEEIWRDIAETNPERYLNG